MNSYDEAEMRNIFDILKYIIHVSKSACSKPNDENNPLKLKLKLKCCRFGFCVEICALCQCQCVFARAIAERNFERTV